MPINLKASGGFCNYGSNTCRCVADLGDTFFFPSTPLHLGTGSRKVQYDVHSKTTFECSVAIVSFSVAQSKSCHLKYWMFSVLPFQLSCDLVKDDGVRFIYHVGS